jgi:predicted nucleic-acid-binding protein
MIGLDTNVLVRYFAQDDPVQSAKATSCIESLTPDSPGLVSVTALVEMLWVLRSCYGMQKPEILLLLEGMLRTKNLIVEQAATVWRSALAFRRSNADFEDCLIQASCEDAGCKYTLTFDQSAVRTAGMRLLR